MRVTGDCFRAERVPVRFADDFRAGPERAVTFVALFLFGPRADLAPLLPRVDGRFDAAVVFRRDFLPDDFDAVAIDRFLGEGTPRPCARFARNDEVDDHAFRDVSASAMGGDRAATSHNRSARL